MTSSYKFKILGSILMLLGTCVGGAMLALPLSAAQYSYSITLLYLVIVWSFTTVGAIALLEVQLWMPCGSNFFTMTKKTLGNYGNVLSLIIYLLLLYSLIAAYIVGSSDIFQGLLSALNIELSRGQSTLIVFTALFMVVAYGIRIIDLTNRFLMLLKLAAFVIILSLMLGKLDLDLVSSGTSTISSLYATTNFKHNLGNFLIIVTSFGFGSILPSLRAYLEDDRKSLTLILILGCIIPLVLYALWILSVHGLISKEGASGLIEISKSNNPNTELINAISFHAGSGFITKIATFFVSICTLTAFLGVSLCLVDFIRDMINNVFVGSGGSKIKHNKNIQNFLVYVLSFAIPLTIALFSPGIFLVALSYAGIMVLLFLVLLPLLMLYIGRYHLGFTGAKFIPGGRMVILFFLSITSIVILLAIRSVVI